MKKNLILLFTIMALGMLSLNAQNEIVVSGTVTNEINGDPVANHDVYIMINDSSIFYSTAITNTNGYYIDTIIPGGFTIDSLYIYTMDLCVYGVHDTTIQNPGSGVTADFEICVDTIPNTSCQADFYFVADSSNYYTFQFFDNSTSNLPVESWNWDFGDGATSGLQNPIHAYNSMGYYNVCLTITSDSGQCTSTACMSIFVSGGGGLNCEAVFSYVADSSNTVYFYDQSIPVNSITYYEWSFGDGNISNLQNPVHTYAAGGTYSVCLYIESADSGMFCSDTLCVDVFVAGSGNNCAANFDMYIDSTQNNTVYFNDLSTPFGLIESWYWDFGDGNTSTQQYPTHTYNASGTYNVCLTITADSGMCTSTECAIITLSGGGVNCNADFYYVPDSTGSNTVYFYDLSTPANAITSYFWSFGDGNSSSQQNPVHTYATSGTYYACLIIESYDAGVVCTDSMCMPVILMGGGVNCNADFYYSYDSLVGNTSTVYFYDLSTPAGMIDSWYWTFGDGSSSTDQNPVHSYTASGVYGICLTITADSGTCTSYHCDTVIINMNYQLQLGGNVFAGMYQLDNGFSYGYKSENGVITEVYSGMIDTLGYYQFYPLAAADYYAKAEPSPNSTYFGQYVPTYYGDVTTWDDALLINLTQNIYTADINLVPVSMGMYGPGTMSGTIEHGSTNKAYTPASDIQIMLINDAGDYVGLVYSDAEGRFEFNGLDYGIYTIHAEVMGVHMEPNEYTITEETPSISDISMILTDDEIFFGPNDIETLGDITLSEVYPNPVSGLLKLEIGSTDPTTVTVRIMNQLGQVMHFATFHLDQTQILEIGTERLQPGMYFLEVISKDGYRSTRRFVKL